MHKTILTLIAFWTISTANAQKDNHQDLGINFAGLLIKNQATVLPSIMYKYKLKNDLQLRFQLALDGKLNSRDHQGNFNNAGAFGGFSQDSSLKYDPGRNIRYGMLLGFQKNIEIDNTQFSCYYGVDIFYMMDDFKQNAKGTVLQGNGGFDTTKQLINLKVKAKNKLNTYGIGIPVGITYHFGKRFYTSLEAKFVIAYQQGKMQNTTETSQIQNFAEFTTKVETSTNLKGFDFGVKPLTGLCVGFIF